jgi:hypothetical protein
MRRWAGSLEVRPQRPGEGPHDPAHRGHACSGSFTHRATRGTRQPVPGHDAGPRPARRRPAGPPRDSADPAGKVAAVLYCDTAQARSPATADLVEILVSYSGKVVDVQSSTARGGSTSPGLRRRPGRGHGPWPPAGRHRHDAPQPVPPGRFRRRPRRPVRRPRSDALSSPAPGPPRPRRPGALFRPRTRRPMKRPSASPAWW